jgi:hypothetical protein
VLFQYTEYSLKGYWKSFDFDVGFVGNSFGSFFLFLFASEVESIEIFKFFLLVLVCKFALLLELLV